MEPPPHFDLERAIAEWRAELAGRQGLAAEDVRTLEAHLRDGVAELSKQGRSPAEAFAQTREHVGAPAAVAKEFAKAGNWRALLMAHWVLLTALLYGLALVVLTTPLILVGFTKWTEQNTFSLADTLEIYNQWGYWAWLGVLVAGQALLLLLPLNIAARRPKARRPVLLPIIASGFFLSMLCAAAYVCAASAAVPKDGDIGPLFSWFDPWTSTMASDDQSAWRGLLCVTLLFWAGWTLLFYRLSRRDTPQAQLSRLMRWLLRGSILELLVAVPSHVIVRRRGDCCAPEITFWGITMGIAVMLLCFGPGVFFLFVDRFRRLKPKTPAKRLAE